MIAFCTLLLLLFVYLFIYYFQIICDFCFCLKPASQALALAKEKVHIIVAFETMEHC